MSKITKNPLKIHKKALKRLKNKIFLIEKINKNERLDSNIIFESKISNNRIDNILRKIKVYFFKFVINLCNDFIKPEKKIQEWKLEVLLLSLVLMLLLS